MKQPSNKEINDYINKIRFILNNNGRLVIKKNRDKNYIFFYLYNITDDFIINILLNRKDRDFNRVVLSNNEFHSKEILYEWVKEIELTDMSGNIDIREIDIKTYLAMNNKTVVVISFHKSKDYS